jgi:membrane protease YdiL (CAAX protease family)
MTSDNPPAAAEIPPSLDYAVPQRIRWGVSDVGLGILALALSVVASLFVGDLDPNAAQFLLGLGGYALILVVIIRATYRKGQRSLRADFLLAFKPVDLLIGLGVGIGMRIVSTLVVLLAVAVTGHTPESGNLVLSDQSIWIVLNGFVLVVLVAPFVEELLLRGLALQSIRNIVLRWRNRTQPAEFAQQKRAVWISIIGSALLFSLLHAAQSTDATLLIALGLSTFILGVVNGMLVYATGRLGAGIVAHVVFNGSAVLIAVLAGGLT